MKNEISGYIDEISRIYKTGNATEHTYRPALQRLLENMLGGETTKNNIPSMPPIQITNEPKRVACGAPDYIVTRGEIPVGYIEAKDIGTDLNGKANKEQFDRYRQSLDNLIITDYLVFRWYVRGEFQAEASIGAAAGAGVKDCPSAFDRFMEIILSFARFQGEGIKTSEQLSKMMAIKARMLASSIESALDEDEQASDVSTLGGQLRGFREALIPQITHKEFSDIYAQTIAYGMFAARLNDSRSGEVFTRVKAAQLIPQSNPFLRKLFQYIAGYDLDSRISWMVDALADLFNCADIPSIQEEFGKKDHDPMLHFYETFLAEYDPALRKSRGVWYTPPSVVQFIARAVDDILKEDFKLADGLADASKITPAKQTAQTTGEMKQEQKSYHRVQILDPAAGTGTFLAEVARLIYSRFENQRGMWRSYVGEHLIPRLNGFEILMASYAMAHLKLDMLLRETGYTPDADNRLRIFLTNSLSSALDKTETPFAEWLSKEANAAGSIKKHDVPVMVVLGNPPYSGESQNSGEWIEKLMLDYKKEPSGANLRERNSKWINDDYVKFIRYGQHFIEKNGEGILAFINNHSFLDNPTFRGMRWSLLNTFDKIYILDLHGNSKKKESAPDGGKDENVFDIQQGVSINIFVKTNKEQDKNPARVLHYDLYGKRSEKYDFLQNNTLKTVKWRKLKLTTPYYFFAAKDFSLKKEYEKGFCVSELFPVNSVGIVTARDNFTVHDTAQAVKNTINEFIKLDVETARDRFNLGKDARDWSVAGAKNDLTSNPDFRHIIEINYRPFDKRFTYYTGHSKGFHCMPRRNVMKHFLKGKNVGLIISRQAITNNWSHIQVSDAIIDNRIHYSNKGIPILIPLYLYPASERLFENGKREPNLNEAIIDKMSKQTGLSFIDEPVSASTAIFRKRTQANPISATFAPIDVLDYIYAVLHSPAYRERYKEFLKIDFPRVPFPRDAAQFRTLAASGAKLRRLHLMEDVEPQPGMADFPVAGSNEIENLKYVGDKVYINNTQYFDRVPSEAWDFYIGGYQPAQKWLKDRKDRIMGYDDIRHYQRIIRVLKETGEITRELDGKWEDEN